MIQGDVGEARAERSPQAGALRNIAARPVPS